MLFAKSQTVFMDTKYKDYPVVTVVYIMVAKNLYIVVKPEYWILKYVGKSMLKILKN